MKINTKKIKEYGYEYDAELNQSIWKKTEGKTTQDKLWGAYCLRSGRDALKAIAREYTPRVVFLPALACDSMVFPFKMYGHTVCYYRLNQDYSIELSDLCINDAPVLFLYMDYFGKKAIHDDALEELREKGNVTFIEDRTHSLIWEKTSTFQPDYSIASLRKWIPIPDGGLLWGKITQPLESDTSFCCQRLKAQVMRHRFLECGDEILKAEYRKIFSEVSEIMDKDGPSAMSEYAYTLTKSTDWDSIRSIRKENAKALIDILQTSPFIHLIQSNPGFSDLYVPFTVQNRNIVQRILSEEGIFNTIIWPLSDEQKKACPITAFTEENMLAAPCDQRFTLDDMNYIGKEILRVTTNVKEQNVNDSWGEYPSIASN